MDNLAPEVKKLIIKRRAIEKEHELDGKKLPLLNIKDVPKKLTDIAENVANISGTWNPVEIYGADGDSIIEERGKFFLAFDKGEEYNPKFKYSYAQNLDLSNAKKQLLIQLEKSKKITVSNKMGRFFKSMLYFKIKDDLATCDLADGIKSRDEEKIARAMKVKYLGIDKSLMDLSKKIYSNALKNKRTSNKKGSGILTPKQKRFIKNKQFDADEIKTAFEWALAQYGILKTDDNPNGFKVVIDKSTAIVDVRDKSSQGPTVFIPISKKNNGETLLSLMAHEIDQHARQSTNGRLLLMLGGGKLKIDSEDLYEGLGLRGGAHIREKLFGIKTDNPPPYYVFAVNMAEKGASFYEIYKDQLQKRLSVILKTPEEQSLSEISSIDHKVVEKLKEYAWLTTYRIMRGHTDTSNKEAYAMTKDLGYLRGYQIDQQLLRHNLGHFNEAGIMPSEKLHLLAAFDLTKDKLPIQFQDVATRYCIEILLPQMQAS